MSKHYAAPEEILYHVGFSAQQLHGATVAVLPGDPGRVEPLRSDKLQADIRRSFCK